jgi:hypothetical protein
MSRPTLSIARKPKPGPSRELIKTAVRLFRSTFAPRALRRANARKWLRAMDMLGDKGHVLNGARVSWGTQTKGIHK